MKLGALLAAAALAGCGALPLPDKPTRPQTYDFGPGNAAAATPAAATQAPLALGLVEAPAALESQAVLYRLMYSDAGQQPRPYAQARWSMPPAQLVGQRLRETLSAARPVVNAGESLAPLELSVLLEEFSQVFESAGSSAGLIRLRATVTAPLAQTGRLVGQRVFTVRRPAPSADAAGGVRALTEATDEAVAQLTSWVATLPVPPQTGVAGRAAQVR